MDSKKTEQEGSGEEKEGECKCGEDHRAGGGGGRVVTAGGGEAGQGGDKTTPFYGEPSSLQIKEVLDTAFKLGGHVERLWNMYLVASVAVVGWAVARGVVWPQKIAVLILYFVFCTVNGSNLFKLYQWLNAAIADLNMEAKRYGETKSELGAAMRKAPRLGRLEVEGLIYGSVFVTVVFIVVYSILNAEPAQPPGR